MISLFNSFASPHKTAWRGDPISSESGLQTVAAAFGLPNTPAKDPLLLSNPASALARVGQRFGEYMAPNILLRTSDAVMSEGVGP